MPISVSISGETSVSVSVSGSTGALVSVSAAGTGVSVSAGGGIGPAGFLTPAGTAVSAYGTLQLAAGNGITLSTANGQFLISSYDTTSVTQLAPVKSVAGRTGDVVLQAADVTAGTFNIARIPTISYTALSNVPVSFVPSTHTHSTTDIVGFSAGLSANHTHDASAITAGVLDVARIPAVGYTALSGVPTAFTPATHTHDASAVASGTLNVARLPGHVQSVNGMTGTITIAAGSNVTVSTTSSTITIAAAAGGTGNVSWVSVPSTPTSSGSAGQFAQNSSYMFACYGPSQWLRVSRAAWIVTPDSPSIASSYGDVGGSPYVSFSWNPPANNGGELTNYVVQRDAESPVTVATSVTTYSFSGLTTSASQCTIYSVSVKAQNSAGQSTAASATIALPQVASPIIHLITKTPNEGAPGVQYAVYWHGPCIADVPYNQFEVQTRLFFNGSTEISQGGEENWESFYSGPNSSASQQISSATSSQGWQFRVRAKYVVNGSLQATSAWGSPSWY